PIAVAGELAADPAERVAEHHRRGEGVTGGEHRQSMTAEVEHSADDAEDQSAEEIESLPREDHAPGVCKELARHLEHGEDTRADNARQRDHQPEVNDQVLRRDRDLDPPPVPANLTYREPDLAALVPAVHFELRNLNGHGRRAEHTQSEGG